MSVTRIVLLTVLLGSSAQAAMVKPLPKDIFRLDLTGFDALNRALENKNKECMEEEDAQFFPCVQEVFEVILGRRSQDDGTRERLYFAQTKRITEVDKLKVFKRLVDDNTNRLKESGLSTDNRATALEVLVNLTKELDPRKTEEKELLVKIKNRDVVIPEDVQNVRTRRMGLKVVSPSIIAGDLLKKVPETKQVDMAKNDLKQEELKGGRVTSDSDRFADDLDLGF